MISTAAPKRSASGEHLELHYTLAELPSSQHRSGLAGLVLMLQWLARQPGIRGCAEVTAITSSGASFRFDRAGMRSVFDAAYGAATEERASKKASPDKPYIRRETRIVEKRGKTDSTEVFIYPVVVPAGAFLGEYDPADTNGQKLWLKLWRDLLWGILRGVPAQRHPYEYRAKGTYADDADEAWRVLTTKGDKAIDLASTYLLGAMANTAENVPFRDLQRLRFLLHFSPFVAQIYVPVITDREGKEKDEGFVVAFPDIASLNVFCDRFPAMMRQRDPTAAGFRPRACRIDVAAESGLDVLSRLRARLAEAQGASPVGDVVVGIDVLHVVKPGKAVKVLAGTRITPVISMIQQYEMIRRFYWDHIFRRQRLANLIGGQAWYFGFSRVMSTYADAAFLSSYKFQHDVREAFKNEGSSSDPMTNADTPTLESLVYRLVRSYVLGRLRSKHGLEWSENTKGSDDEARYNEEKTKLAREAFLAVRSRTGSDFVEYFASTLCSTPQWLPESDYLKLSRQLHEHSEKVRTLTLLALCAQTYGSKSQERKSDNG